MDKKKTGITIIIIIVLAIVLGICFMRLGGQDGPDNRDEAQSVTTTESTVEQGIEPSTELTTEPTVEASIEPAMEPGEENQETDATQEQQTESGTQAEDEQQEEKTVLIVEDDGVRDNPIFAAFIDKEIMTYDAVKGENKYIYEYFADYVRIEYVHYMTEDLNQDTKNELLVYVGWTWGYGELLVFEETDRGELISWEIWEYIINDRQPDIYYCGNGIFMMDGVRGVSVGHYTQKGSPELLMDYYHTLVDNNDTYYVMIIWLGLYENGGVVKELEYERYCDIETHKDIIELESEEAREGERLKDEILAALGERKEVTIDGAEYRDEYKDKVKTVLLEELQSP